MTAIFRPFLTPSPPLNALLLYNMTSHYCHYNGAYEWNKIFPLCGPKVAKRMNPIIRVCVQCNKKAHKNVLWGAFFWQYWVHTTEKNCFIHSSFGAIVILTTFGQPHPLYAAFLLKVSPLIYNNHWFVRHRFVSEHTIMNESFGFGLRLRFGRWTGY